MLKQMITEQAKRDDDGFDLVASGAAGRWNAFIDETHAGPEKWHVQIEGPCIYFSFEIPSVKTIDDLVQFLARSTVSPSDNSSFGPKATDGSLSIGGGRTPVTFVRDDEYTARCVLMLGSAEDSVMRYSVDGTDLLQLIDALRQASEELKSQGLLP